MAHWSGKLLCVINAYKLKKTCLFEDDIFVCPHCEARLFEEEKDRKKSCCGEGVQFGRPRQRFATKVGDVQFVNRCRLYINDGEERRNIATIANYLYSINPFIGDFLRLGNEPSVNAHLEFQVTSRATHGNVLGDRNRGVEVHAVLNTDEAVTEPRRLAV
ncbi:hypothetical protein J6590_084252 [Homalodisca vitripennis]|nr:hypothetical protein J6590_084252 [Homalodisca vitripennis]